MDVPYNYPLHLTSSYSSVSHQSHSIIHHHSSAPISSSSPSLLSSFHMILQSGEEEEMELQATPCRWIEGDDDIGAIECISLIECDC